MPADAHELLKMHEKLVSDRSNWMNHWEDLARLMLPRRRGFVEGVQEGSNRTEDNYDGTPMVAARGLANALASMNRPEGEPWFFVKAAGVTEETDNVVRWLDNAANTVRAAFEDPRSRFRQATGEIDLDLVVFGTGCGFMGESDTLDHLVTQSFHMKDIVIFWDEFGNALGVMREEMMPIRTAVKKFTLEKLSTETQKKFLAGRIHDEIKMLQCVVPRERGMPGAIMGVALPVAHVWIEVDAKRTVREGGFNEFPFFCPRWDTSSGENYGRSPGMYALSDASTLQAMGETILVAGQRAAEPPLAAPADGAFHEINTYPGGISYYDIETAQAVRGNPFFSMTEGSLNLPITRDMQMDVRMQVQAAFFRNVLNLPIEGPQMTATEVIERKEEFIRELGPIFGRLETDYTAPMVERAFRIMFRAGVFGPPPPELAGVRFEYESPVKKIKEQVEAASARLWVQELAGLTQVDPGAMDPVNMDEFAKFTHSASNLPLRLLASDDEIKAKRDERNRQAEQARQMEMAQQGAKALRDAGGAKAVEEAVTG
jgi:hypothetical protein